ncbi:MAG: 2-dehydro-3-deoxygalactonokinase, partial [Opitutaceae bacterium]
MVNTTMPHDVFIGCDWGSTSFRLRVVERGTRRILAGQSSANGVKAFTSVPPAGRAASMSRFFAEQLAACPEVGQTAPIIITGMASSNVGWRELPYASAPFPLDGSQAKWERLEFSDLNGRPREALLVSGVRTADDVMRGEECALIGAPALCPIAAAPLVLCLLAGTHPKHALLRERTLVSFRTHLTGELFDLLSRESLLAGSVGRAALDAPPDLGEVSAGVACFRERGVSGALFQVRSRHLSRNTSRAANAWFLSGILMGGELERIPLLCQGAALLLIGDPLRVTLYRTALRELGAVTAAESAVALPLTEAIV